jgi:hypothetical protein
VDRTHTPGPSNLVRRGQQLLGAALLLFAFAPIYRLMDTSGEAPFRETSVGIAESTLQLAWWGTVVTILLSGVLAVLLPTAWVRLRAERGIELLMRPATGTYALALALVALGVASLVATRLYQGFFTNVDEIASYLHARYLAAGMLAGPTHGLPEFWLIPNTLVVPEGWVSQYPPTHLVAMGVLERLGLPSFLGPVSYGAMVGLLTLSLVRLLPGEAALARVAALLVSVCPLLFFLGGGSLNHVTTGALLSAALYAMLRGRDGHAGWSVVAGLAVGLAVADRPLTGLILGTAFVLGVWGPPALKASGSGTRWLAVRLAGLGAGGMPIAVLLGWYNARLFGDPRTLGYLAAFGDRHRLGFHADPWGSYYGIADAVAFTSTDMLAAGVQLLETPYPATALIGAALLSGMRLPRGGGVLLAWALVPVLANAYYWFHSARMLFEAAPAWVALYVLAAAHLVTGGETPPSTSGRAIALARDACVWALVFGVLYAAGLNLPSRWNSYTWTQDTLDRIRAPILPTEVPSIVFVHASWNERLSSTLQGAGGMRQDSIISALRRNTNCQLQAYALAREARVRHGLDVTLPAVDLDQSPGAPADIERPASPSGATLRIRRGERFSDVCLRELRSDRFGAVALAPLLWQGDLPGIEMGRDLFVRDFGPERNQRVLELYPERTAFVFTPTMADGAPEIMPYDDAMTLLWGP